MLNPAWNCSPDAALQFNMTLFRVIENGFPFLRPTRYGYLASADNDGRIVAVS
jgi:apolipoprotein N-acyltransferase